MYQILKSVSIPTLPLAHKANGLIHTHSYITPSKEKYIAAFGGFVANFMFGGYLAVGNFIPYLASYLTAIDYQSDVCTQSIQDSYASNTAMSNWLITAFVFGMHLHKYFMFAMFVYIALTHTQDMPGLVSSEGVLFKHNVQMTDVT